jgi:hypothetical protein
LIFLVYLALVAIAIPAIMFARHPKTPY